MPRRHEPRPTAVVAAALLVSACYVRGPEEQLLARFFEAARLHDTTRVSRYATVGFNPKTEGTVRDFEVTDVDEIAGVTLPTKEVVVAAELVALDGSSSRTTLVFTFQRQPEAEGVPSRWMIVGYRRRSR